MTMMRHNKSFSRIDRIQKQILQELAKLICTDLKDPRLSRVIPTEIHVSKDCAVAKVYYTILAAQPCEHVQAALDNAAGYFRSKIGQKILLFTTPQLHFIYDHSVEQGAKIDRLLAQIQQE